jgi:N-acetylneuraminate synthase/N,N'-diacetyllegionaminate synthase
MADLDEVADAVATIRAAGNPELCLLHCTTEYPTSPADVNLRAMQTLAAKFGVPVGYSDHTRGIEVSLAAVALGAVVIEKHFTLDRGLPGPDHRASLEPEELTALVRGVRTVSACLGDGRKIPCASEMKNRMAARKSVVAVRDIAAGALIGVEDIAVRRPGNGLPPSRRNWVIGRRALIALSAGMVVTAEAVE